MVSGSDVVKHGSRGAGQEEVSLLKVRGSSLDWFASGGIEGGGVWTALLLLGRGTVGRGLRFFEAEAEA